MPPVSATPEPVIEEDAAPSLAARLRSRATVISVVVVVLIVAFGVWRADINWSGTFADVRQANPALFALALLAYYLSFAVRGLRWRILLENVGERRRVRPLTLIVISSFFVNCVVPAKMGDVYRAYLVRQREHVPGARAFGTIVAERLVDLLVLMSLLVLAALGVARNKVPRDFLPYLVSGGVLCLFGVAAFVVMAKGRGRRLLVLLPERAVLRYEHFREGTVGALGNLQLVLPLTVLIWGLEATRLGLVVESLPVPSGALGPASFLLIALVAALLTTVPFTPGGLGLVEGGMVVVLTSIGNLPKELALSAALLDRSISYLSLLIVGFVVFALTYVRSTGRAATLAPTKGHQ